MITLGDGAFPIGDVHGGQPGVAAGIPRLSGHAHIGRAGDHSLAT
jgi:hypothetical protein